MELVKFNSSLDYETHLNKSAKVAYQFNSAGPY